MSGIINTVGARSGIISSGGSASAGTVTLSGTTGLGYEEGTFTATNASGSPQSQQCIYTKIGRVVHCSCTMYTRSAGTSASLWSGLPFSIVTGEGYRSGGVTSYQNHDTSKGQMGVLLLGSGFYFENPNEAVDLAANTYVYFHITYFTTS